MKQQHNKWFHGLVILSSSILLGGAISFVVYQNHTNVSSPAVENVAQKPQRMKHIKATNHKNNIYRIKRNRKHHRHNRRRNDRKYRIYSQHYLSAEHEDLSYLKGLGNSYAKSANSISENSNANQIYTRWYDHNYWSYFRDHYTFKPYHSHMSNRTFNIVNRRVLASHGVHHGINFKKNSKHRIDYPMNKGIAG